MEVHRGAEIRFESSEISEIRARNRKAVQRGLPIFIATHSTYL